MTMIKRPHNHSVFAVSCRFGRIEAGKPLLQFGRVFVGNNDRCSLLKCVSPNLDKFQTTLNTDIYSFKDKSLSPSLFGRLLLIQFLYICCAKIAFIKSH